MCCTKTFFCRLTKTWGGLLNGKFIKTFFVGLLRLFVSWNKTFRRAQAGAAQEGWGNGGGLRAPRSLRDTVGGMLESLRLAECWNRSGWTRWRNPGIISAGKASIPTARSLSRRAARAGSAVPSGPARHFLPGRGGAGRGWGGAAPPQSRGHGGLREGAGAAGRAGSAAGAAGGRRRGLCGVGRCAGARQVPGDRCLFPRPPPGPGAGRGHRRRRHHGSHAGVSGRPCPARSSPSDPFGSFKPCFLCCAEHPLPSRYSLTVCVLQSERDGHRPGGAAGAVDG